MVKKNFALFLAAVLIVLTACGVSERGRAEKERGQSQNRNGRQAQSSGTDGAGTIYVSEILRNGCFEDSLVFVSHNAYNFGKSKSPEEIAFVAKLFRGTDIVALQEVSTTDSGAQVVARLSDALNRTGAKWDYAVSSSTHESPDKEKFAFLWKTSRVKVVPQGIVLLDMFKDELVREPAKINFRVDNKYELVAINFHLAPTEKNPKAEVAALSKNQQAFSGNNVILAGDFNLSHRDLNPYFEDVLGFRHRIEGKTSLKQKNDKKGSHLSKEYDNIYTRGKISVCKSAILDFVPKFPDLKEARKISDHLPVLIIFNFSD